MNFLSLAGGPCRAARVRQRIGKRRVRSEAHDAAAHSAVYFDPCENTIDQRLCKLDRFQVLFFAKHVPNIGLVSW